MSVNEGYLCLCHSSWFGQPRRDHLIRPGNGLGLYGVSGGRAGSEHTVAGRAREGKMFIRVL